MIKVLRSTYDSLLLLAVGVAGLLGMFDGIQVVHDLPFPFFLTVSMSLVVGGLLVMAGEVVSPRWKMTKIGMHLVGLFAQTWVAVATGLATGLLFPTGSLLVIGFGVLVFFVAGSHLRRLSADMDATPLLAMRATVAARAMALEAELSALQIQVRVAQLATAGSSA